MVAASLSSGFGVWNPLIWLLVFAIGCIIAYVVWRSGVSGFRKGTGQGRPYLSGNEEPAKGDVHIRAGNLYW
ncbi:MAG TPA: hydrogenase, partial [Methanolinea sp.]|nr:hydrogenase [Methanolinea sp.]